MFEWFSEQYIELLANVKILLGDLTHCFAVDRLRIFSLILAAIFGIKIILHHLIYHRLKMNFPEYSASEHPTLRQVFSDAVQKVSLKRVPRLHQFRNQNPLVFAIGTFRPMIFLAPALLKHLTRNELEAVLVHELAHIKHRDTFLKWLLELALVAIPLLVVVLFAFNFVFSGFSSQLAFWGSMILVLLFRGVIWKQIIFLRELACDDQSVKADADPVNLASSLVKVCQTAKALPTKRWGNGLVFAQTLIPTFSKLEFRIQRLLSYKTPRFRMFFAKVVRVTAWSLLFGFLALAWRFHSTHGLIELKILHIQQANDCVHKIVLVDNK
ncbi:M56 family metallopeptidase [candidate division KSB1 bacterium]|nr:M56 family metallopeptidase [candidate division KSB1 bacterium]NIR69698.1 M56 family metallopeptidase [candidate division KSB1 bacterium]NIS24894.1 M56 family metallopeptidase [candidate division KSB1 bacterium]NIT69743.1 M56 family metallopeptidase [candidate division KSB1 bacterium]NIU23413.1 M56 family metallopeptidase [candidate division KSB1 bacterium]